MKKHRIGPEVKEQIIKRIKEEGISVMQAAKEHGASDASIYTWLGKGVKKHTNDRRSSTTEAAE